MLHSIYTIIPDLHLLIKEKYPRHKKRQVFLTYIRLLLKQLFFSYQPKKGRLIREKICGYTVHAFSRGSLWFLFREIFVKGQYAFYTDVPTPTILDCGGNIGMATLFFKWMYPDSTILVFEPDPQAFGVLESNIKENNLSSVILHNSAVGETHGTTTLYTQPENPASLLTSTVKKRQGGVPVTVPLETVSAHITGTVDFLKIDTEGAEAGIIKDLCTTGAIDKIKEMVIEYHHNIDREKSVLAEILTDIEQSGFTYQIGAPFSPLIRKHRFQDMLLYCYRNDFAQRKG